MEGEFTPEQLQMLMELGIIPEQLDEMQMQMKQAMALRDRGGPEGRSAGRTYVAANPMEHIGEFMQKRNAKKELEALKAQTEALRQQQATSRGMYANQLFRPGQPMQSQMPAGPQTPMQQMQRRPMEF
jgi:hypothetical protein